MKQTRPPKISNTKIKQIAKCIESGLYAIQACEIAHINETTYYRWMKRGLKEPDSIYGEFCQSIRIAEAKGEIMAILKIRNEEDWRAAAWYLERRFNKRWGKKDKLEVDQTKTLKEELQERSDIDVSKLDLEQLKQLETIYDKAEIDDGEDEEESE